MIFIKKYLRLIPLFALITAFIIFTAYRSCPKENAAPLSHPKNVHFLSQIKSASDFVLLQGKPLSQKFGNVSAVKVVYEIATKKIYFVNGKKYRFHYDFCSEYLGAYNDIIGFNHFEYSDSPKRKFLLANVNHYESNHTYTLEFFPDDHATAPRIHEIYEAVKSSTYFGNKLKILINSGNLKEKEADIKAPKISTDSLYNMMDYQLLNPGKTFGILRKVSAEDFDSFNFSPGDIIFTNELPNDFPLSAGMLTSVFQTPLCHVNILSTNRGTPNAALRSAWNNEKINALVGKMVYFAPGLDTLVIREATQQELAEWVKKKKKKHSITLDCDGSKTGLIDLSTIGYKDKNIVGGKAANFAEMMRISTREGNKIPLPESAFAIPFHYYLNHIKNNHLQSAIDSVLTDVSLLADRNKLEKKLKSLRKRINAASLDKKLVQLVKEKMALTPEWKAFRFRSSTNAEDVPGFNGAGLYDSNTGSLTDEKKSIERAIKKTWSSLWNLRAVEERMFFNIDHKNLAMGILVHRSFGTEEANGVVITKNMYRPKYPSFTVNVQTGETGVALPPKGVVCEQFLINFTENVTGKQGFSIEYITRSNIAKGSYVMSQKEIEELAGYLEAIKAHFFYRTNYGNRYSSYFDFAMDIEFKLDAKTRKIYIKQARLF